ncbi:hypothetical protein HSISB1_1982 [Streptococcus sp. HSISB1]|nr:hypothetical protein HSISB1_1982 [Streptococcus sp. HSISB1]
MAVDTFNDYKEKFESGELTTDEFLEVVKEKGQAAADFASEKVSEFTSKVSEVVDEADDVKEETKAEVADIIIDYTPKDETPTSENEKTETTEDKE